jgi:C1A family cysteine protease/sugar lactone lactonase YvrE
MRPFVHRSGIASILMLTLAAELTACGSGGGNSTLPMSSSMPGTSSDALHSLGLVKANPADIARMPQIRHALSVVPLPAVVDLSPKMPSVGDQGQEGSCVAWASAYALRGYEARLDVWSSIAPKTTAPANNFSPAFVYNQLNGGVDHGLTIPSALILMEQKGVGTLADMPYVAGQFTTQPSAAAIANATHYKLASYGAIAPTDLTTIKTQVSNGVPVILAINVYMNFETLGNGQIYTGVSGQLMGGHAITIVGYDDSKQAVEIINSWGTYWGSAGYGWISYTALSKIASEAYSAIDGLAPSATPTPTPTPTVKPTATPVPTPVPTVKPPVPTVKPTPTPVPTVKPTPTPVPTAKPTPTPVPTVKPTPTPTPKPSPTPVSLQGIVTTFAGGIQGYQNGTGAGAQFNGPDGVAVDSIGNVYVADWTNQRIRKITAAGVVTTLAGSSQGYKDGTGNAAQFFNPRGVAVDAGGNVYVADRGNNRIRKITPTGIVTTLAGSTSGFQDGTGTAAQFFNPFGVTVDASSNVYVADQANNRIRKITSTGIVTTLAGSGAQAYQDGTGTAAKFTVPVSVAVDAGGNVYVADAGSSGFPYIAASRIRKITSAGLVTTLAGSGTPGFQDGIGTVAQFNIPQGVAVDASGNVYVADAGNNRIRKIRLPR